MKNKTTIEWIWMLKLPFCYYNIHKNCHVIIIKGDFSLVLHDAKNSAFHIRNTLKTHSLDLASAGKRALTILPEDLGSIPRNHK